ncbi:uracil-DNA glycosylase [Gammaproteobacteria bacterium]|nr:uracil-DNA glycosylase [Gammaproteobacteria bacterium]MDC0401682.1 uracil-DNA glycosylase [Gammaproteobacteria bacterium]
MHKHNLDIKLPQSWEKELKNIKLKYNIYSPLNQICLDINKGHDVYPPVDKIFNAFNLCSFDNTKVVIFGQDPYHQKGLANGLAFAVNKGNKIPPSLRNIYKEIHDDLGFCYHNLGNLEEWARQGVLLLNTSLSVIDSLPGSHSNIGWSVLIDSVIQILSNKRDVIFLLWGSSSAEKEYLIDSEVNYVLKSSHPSPLSSYRGFFGCKHFSKTNDILLNMNKSPIIW